MGYRFRIYVLLATIILCPFTTFATIPETKAHIRTEKIRVRIEQLDHRLNINTANVKVKKQRSLRAKVKKLKRKLDKIVKKTNKKILTRYFRENSNQAMNSLSLFLIDSRTGLIYIPLINGTTFQEGQYTHVNVLAVIPHSHKVDYVTFRIAHYQLEDNISPFTLLPDPGFYTQGWNPVAGTYPLSAAAYLNDVLIASESIEFTVTESTTPKIKAFHLVNAETDQTIRTLNSGDTIHTHELQSFNIVAVTNPIEVPSVVFEYTNYRRVESRAPYALAGDDENGDYFHWDAPNGTVEIVAGVYSEARGRGELLSSRSLTLNISASPQPSPSPTASSTPSPTPSPSPSPSPSLSPSPSPTASPSPSEPPSTHADWSDYQFTNISHTRCTRAVYVDSISGNDSASGFSPSNARKTIREAIFAFSAGESPANCLYLKRGGTYSSSGISGDRNGYYDFQWLRGESKNNYAVLADYGDPNAPAPILIPHTSSDSDAVIAVQGNKKIRNAVIANITFRPHNPESFQGYPIKVTGGEFDNVTLENLDIRYFREGIVLQSANSSSQLHDITLRRSAIIGNGSPDVYHNIETTNGSRSWHNRASGIFATRVVGLTIEDSVFGLNGWTSWHPRIFAEAQTLSGAEGWNHDKRFNANIFSHENYIQYTSEDIVIRNNIYFEASSHAIQSRPGGDVYGNVVYRCPLGIVSGSIEATDRYNDKYVRGNVFDNVLLELQGINEYLDNTGRGGWAIQANPGELFYISNNLIANNQGLKPRTLILDKGSNADLGREVYFTNNRILQAPNPFIVNGNYTPGSVIGDPSKNIFSQNKLNSGVLPSNHATVGTYPNIMIRMEDNPSTPIPASAYNNHAVSDIVPLLEDIHNDFGEEIQREPFKYRAREIRALYGSADTFE